MKSIFLILLSFLTPTLIFSQKNHHVLYGEHLEISVPSKNTYQIFYDKNGDLYPDFFIPDSSLANYGSSLKSYFQNKPQHFRTAAAMYHLAFNAFSESNFKVFQTAIATNAVKKINSESKDFKAITILIHGFRKPFRSFNHDNSSAHDNEVFQSKIKGLSKDTNAHYFLEVYWDGMYISPRRKLKDLTCMLKLFKKQAIQNATQTGYRLREIVSQIETEELSFIAHSLGAQVATTCAINAVTKSVGKFNLTLPTPPQKQVNICLIAPAISEKLFENYAERITTIDFKKEDNYRLFILYNEQDVVLRKKWKGIGPGPKMFGKTTLGCNHRRAAEKLQEKFIEKYPNTLFELSNASDYGWCHSVRCYVGYRNFSELMAFLWKS